VVVHFDEIQNLMVTPKGWEKSLVSILAEAIDDMVNSDPPRSWIKFVLTGTNIFIRTRIKIGIDVKYFPIALDGVFPMEFVSGLARDHGIYHLFAGTNYLERSRHNRRFTELFFFGVWARACISPDACDVEKAYAEAFGNMKEQICNQITSKVPVSQVACSFFEKILAIP